MKKILVVIIAIIISSNYIYAQNKQYRSTICINAGWSLVSTVPKIFAKYVPGVTDLSTPIAIQCSYDFGILKWLSIGAAGSFQNIGLKFDGFDYTAENGDEYYLQSFEANINRLNIAIRPLFHYANSGKLDLYSGMRFGYTKWTAKTTAVGGFDVLEAIRLEDYSIDLPKFGISTFAFQLVVFGFRTYFNDNIGINMELAVGSPHVVSGGVNFRF